MHQITREWLFMHRTHRGAWTRDQLEAIGVFWPPKAGWIERRIGKDIPDDAKRQFEAKLPAKALRLASMMATELFE
jgi:hypothetical protein